MVSDISGISGISVAMCSYNGERHLNAQLESIAGQERPPDELIICDDGSTDGSHDILKNFARGAHFPVRLVMNEKNLGSTRSFEKAISLCQYSVVALSDQDDVWYRHKLGRIETAFQRPERIVAAFSDADLIDDGSNLLHQRLWASFSFSRSEQRRFAASQSVRILLKHYVVTGATMAFRKRYFHLFAPIPADHVHDSWISFLLAALGPFAVISEPLMQYRRHGGQQLGPGALTFRDRMAQVKNTGADQYLEEAKRFQDLSERLRERSDSFPDALQIRKRIEKKTSLLQHRARLPSNTAARIPGVLRRALNGDYHLYAEGWKSVAKDLLIR